MKSLALVGSVTRLRLRLERRGLPVGILLCISFAVCFLPLIPLLVSDEQMLQVMQETMSSPMMAALCGMFYGDTYTFGIMYTQMMYVFSALLVAIMNILLVNRHTRKDEEQGRLELIAALPVGKAAPLASVAGIALAANVIIALGIAATMPLLGVEGIDFAGSLVFGAAVGAAGFVFAGVGLVCAQLASSAKGSMGLSMGILCLCYLLRAAGDIPSDAAHNPLGFASVLGLGERAYPYYENLWWPLGVMLGIAAVLTALAFILGGVRDHGAGLLPLLRGKAHAGRLLVGQLSLGLRLMRGLIFAWALIILLLSASYGYVFNDMDAFYKGSEILQAILGTPGADANILEPVIHTISAMMALLSVVPVVLIIGRLGTEERRGRLDLIYAGASSRTHAFVGYALIAALVATLLQVLAAFGIGAAQALSMDNPVALVVFMRAALNMLPAVLVFEGIALCLLGAAPRFMPALWLHLGYSLYGVYLAGAFALPEWLTMLNPFSALARYPVEPFAWVPWCILLAIFVALGALGAVRYRFRSLN